MNSNMETRVGGLYAAGEAVGGANGANRLSGNAITEAFVFGDRAGSSAAEAAKQTHIDCAPELAMGTLENAWMYLERDRPKALSRQFPFRPNCRK